ncbi:hypothetical protein U9M48_030721 [Paspalum notatum var. saurae]|uniref:Uncharacterized protein n=1 Tax=Paspalum notatum var. saurae TaxID=547442 RepID=A0AAQ3U3I7_PASNO
MWFAVACSAASLGYVLTKVVMSLALAAAHLAMAYRACCRERRRLLVYRIDVEAGLECAYYHSQEHGNQWWSHVKTILGFGPPSPGKNSEILSPTSTNHGYACICKYD